MSIKLIFNLNNMREWVDPLTHPATALGIRILLYEVVLNEYSRYLVYVRFLQA